MSYWVNFMFKVNWAQVDSGSRGTTHPRASFCTADVTFQFWILALWHVNQAAHEADLLCSWAAVTPDWEYGDR